MRQNDHSGTFLIRVLYKQHGTWQGEITWVEKKEKKYFRSMLELIRLIDDVVGEPDEKMNQIKKSNNGITEHCYQGLL